MKNINNYLTHGIHPYHAKFIPSIPKDFLKTYTKVGDTVLDPFCGSGTTLLECMLSDRFSVGVDLNEIAYRISKAKVFIPEIKTLNECYHCIIDDIENVVIENEAIFDNKDIWYEKIISNQMDRLLTNINKIDNWEYRNIFKVILSSICKTVSNKRETWNNGYIADNVLPNKKYTGDAILVFKKRYKEIEKSYIELNECFKEKQPKNPMVLNKNILEFSTKKKFDAIITSPPYPFAVDFAKYNRLSFYWLGVDVEESAEKETGARTKRNRKNANEVFFAEMEIIYLHLFDLVRKNGFFCMTVADTKRKKENIFFVDWLIELFTKNGWEVVQNDIRVLENQSMAQKRIPEEHKLVFKKL